MRVVVSRSSHRPVVTRRHWLVDSLRMTAQLACDALQMALWRRDARKASLFIRTVVVNTVQGISGAAEATQPAWQYECERLLYDNACVESFFHSLKVECIHGNALAAGK